MTGAVPFGSVALGVVAMPDPAALLSQLALVATALLAPMAIVALVNLVAAPRLHRRPARTGGPAVSVLVPARNEADNLRRLLPALLETRYGPLEIVVLDDASSDATRAVVRALMPGDPRLRLVEGLDPPVGWAGKNWACHQLFHHARGELLLFCDADVVPGPDAVGRTVAALADADAVTAFPRHERGGWLEQAVVPLIAKVPVAALLPLPLVRWTRARSLAVGNGQWFGWRRDAYEAAGGHRAIAGEVLDDVHLARRAKAVGARLTATLATRDLAVRMYRSPREVRDGFAKNLYPLAGGRPWSFAATIAVFVLTTMVPLLLPLLAAAGPLRLVPLGLLVVVRGASALAFRDPLAALALHPYGAAAVVGIAVDSWRRHRRGNVTWKRRILTLREPL